jgi:cell division protein ZapB
MSLEVLEKLEEKIQTAVDTITLLQMELDEVKQKNQRLEQAAENVSETTRALEEQNQQLVAEHNAWQDKIRHLLGKMDEIE